MTLTFPTNFNFKLEVINVGTNNVTNMVANGRTFAILPITGGVLFQTKIINRYIGKAQTFKQIGTNFWVTDDFRPLKNIVDDATNNIPRLTQLSAGDGSVLTNYSYTNLTDKPVVTSGTNGAQGIQGVAGTNGLNGTTGAQGIQGIQGVAGSNGTNGATGSQGVAGSNGTNGISGTNGPTGATGSQGIQGVSGSNGTNGTNGLNGAQGIQGTAGVNGTNAAVGLVTNQFTTNLTVTIAQFQPALNYQPATNGASIAYSQLPYTPATNTDPRLVLAVTNLNGVQPSSAALTNLAALNGSGLTNLPYAFAFTSTNGYWSPAASGVQLGATNWTFVLTNLGSLPVTIAPSVTNQFLPTNGANLWLSGAAVFTNGSFSTVSNLSPVTAFSIATSVTTFFTNTFGRDIVVGYTATTVTGIGLAGTNAGTGGAFNKWQSPLTGGSIPLRHNHTVAFTNGLTVGNATWTPFP